MTRKRARGPRQPRRRATVRLRRLVGTRPGPLVVARSARGAVTAELAAAFAAIGFILAVAVGAVGVAVAQLQCVDSARAAARVAARGEASAAVLAEARQRAPAGAVVSVDRSSDAVRVTVRDSVRLLAPLPAIAVSATSVAAVEGLG